METILIIGLIGLIVWLIRAVRKVQQTNLPDIEDVNYNELRKADYDKIKKIKGVSSDEWKDN